MKMIAPCSLRAYPSIKGIYSVLLCILSTTFLFSQDNNWEIGIALRPLSIKEDSYNFILKKNVSNKIALRFGFGGVYKTSNEYFQYNHPYIDSIHKLSYEYTKIYKNLNINGFVGIQFGKRKNLANFYSITDIIFRYSRKGDEIPIIFYPGVSNLFPNEFFETGNAQKNKIMGFGIRQTLGIEYYVNQKISISIEGGGSYEFRKVKKDDFSYFRNAYSGTSSVVYGNQTISTQSWNYEFLILPLSLILLSYHF